MKKHIISQRAATALAALVAIAVTASAQAQSLDYNVSSNPGWNTATSWSSSGPGGPFNSNWVAGNTANFTFTTQTDVNVTTDTSAGGLVTASGATPAATVRLYSTNAGTDMTLSGTVNVGSNRNVQFGFGSNTALGVGGSFTKTGNGQLAFTTYSGSTSTLGTVALNQGVVLINDPDFVSSTNSNFSMGGGTLNLQNTITIANLSGSTGTVQNVLNQAGTLVVTSTGANTYGGVLKGNNGTGNLTFTKNGTGSLSLSGSVEGMTKTVNVNAGSLLIDTATTSFGDSTATTAISVNSGGTLGGNGTITTLIGDKVVVADNGGLAPGALGAAGNLTIAGDLDISSMATAGKLAFDLGTASDKITLSSTFVLSIGTLNSSEFAFTLGSGFGAGTYTLFDTGATITATSLDTAVFSFNASYDGQLQFANSNQDIQLLVTAVPEPSTWLLLAGSLTALIVMRRRRPSDV